MRFFKKMSNGWSPYEISYLIVALTVPTALAIIFKSGIFNLLSALASLLSALFLTKGKPTAYPLAIASAFLHAYVAYEAKVYGETAIGILILFPIAVYGLTSWVKNNRKMKGNVRVVIINKLKPAEYIILFTSQAFASVGYYFLLKWLNTEHLIISTLAVTSGIIASYLLARRSEHGLLSYIFNDIILLGLWFFVVINGNIGYLPLLATPTILLFNDVYGVMNWRRMKREQVLAELDMAELKSVDGAEI